ncbi:MAG: hypothetical protein F4Z40_00885 [Chloroflexi bacterium]|nr:hypothetical protein [Chloroflexota bacterium]
MSVNKSRIGNLGMMRRARPFDRNLNITLRTIDGYQAEHGQLRIIHTQALEGDARWWDHVSVSRADGQIPTYDDLKLAKRLTLGPDRTAVQLFVRDVEHIDIRDEIPEAREVLHLWSAKKMPLPDFTRGGQGL